MRSFFDMNLHDDFHKFGFLDHYSKYTLCSDLLWLLDQDVCPEQIAKWADSVFCRYDRRNIDPLIYDLLQCFQLFELEEFVHSYDDILELCILLLQGKEPQKNDKGQTIIGAFNLGVLKQ